MRIAITARKEFHVSPFQDVAGGYAFQFDIRPEAIAIRILHRAGDAGLVATLAGPRLPMTAPRLLRAAARFPFSGARALTLIYWQALRLRLKGARYRPPPPPPVKDITQCQRF